MLVKALFKLVQDIYICIYPYMNIQSQVEPIMHLKRLQYRYTDCSGCKHVWVYHVMRAASLRVLSRCVFGGGGNSRSNGPKTESMIVKKIDLAPCRCPSCWMTPTSPPVFWSRPLHADDVVEHRLQICCDILLGWSPFFQAGVLPVFP